MSSIVQTIQKKTTTQKTLPISSPIDYNNNAGYSAHGGPKSSLGFNPGSSIKSLWDLGWAWVQPKKQDLAHLNIINEDDNKTHIGVEII
ncbi:hypothetical protein vseg_012771 [Gypsophila vaccaria]